MENLAAILQWISYGISLIGGAIMIAGVVVSIYRLARVEVASFRETDVEHDRRTLRHHLGYYILLGLEFIVVADVLQTIVHPGLDEIFTLGIVVLIRTVIGVTLNWELSRTEQVKEEHP